MLFVYFCMFRIPLILRDPFLLEETMFRKLRDNIMVYGAEGFDPDLSVAPIPSDPSDGIIYAVFPGFCDVHVHFREPGFSYKETILTGSMAAGAGGYTDVCTMPNTSPVCDSEEHMMLQKEIIDRDAVIGVHPYAAITLQEKGQVLTDMEELAAMCVAFSDDGKGVQDEDMMRKAFLKAKETGKLIASHCEVDSLLNGGYIHDGEWCASHGHRGICSESEYAMIERDVALAEETGAEYHVCHVSAKESVDIIRRAKERGVHVTCETAPHYLLLDENDLEEDGRFKMNPPLRSREDRLELIRGIQDGTIDMIATDHAPHSAEEKSRGLEGSSFGISGIECAFPLLYTYLVEKGVISLDKLTELICVNPRKRFGLPYEGSFTVFELGGKHFVDSSRFISKGHSTPFDRYEVHARCVYTLYRGKAVYKKD